MTHNSQTAIRHPASEITSNSSQTNEKKMSDDIRHIILQQLSNIPKGQVCTYGDLAKLSGYPSHARFVGRVLRTLPEDTKLPWHRVINGQGKISFTKDSSAYKEQSTRLENEGVYILNGKINLKTYRVMQ